MKNKHVTIYTEENNIKLIELHISLSKVVNQCLSLYVDSIKSETIQPKPKNVRVGATISQNISIPISQLETIKQSGFKVSEATKLALKLFIEGIESGTIQPKPKKAQIGATVSSELIAQLPKQLNTGAAVNMAFELFHKEVIEQLKASDEKIL